MVPSSVTIITPLAFEAQCLHRLAQTHQWPVVVCGPGPDGIQQLAERARIPRGDVVILAGLAGGLGTNLKAGDLIVAEQITDEHGAALTPPLQLPEAKGRLCEADHICRTPDDKERLRAHSGADAVDLESARFAALAADRGWLWGVVRGISDDASTSLPRDCPKWTSLDGRLRPQSLLWSILKDPRLVFELPGLGRRSRLAMESVGQGLLQLVSQVKIPPDGS